MRIEIPKIVKILALAEYAEAFGEQTIDVWVNPPRNLVQKFGNLMSLTRRINEQIDLVQGKKVSEAEVEKLKTDAEEVKHDLAEWYAEIWSQGDNPITALEVRDLFESAQDIDPAFEQWLVDHTWEMIGEHREGQKKV